jgi:hypothetical protein
MTYRSTGHPDIFTWHTKATTGSADRTVRPAVASPLFKLRRHQLSSVSILNLKVSFLQLAASFSEEFFQLLSVIVLAGRGRDLCIPVQHSRRTTVHASIVGWHDPVMGQNTTPKSLNRYRGRIEKQYVFRCTKLFGSFHLSVRQRIRGDRRVETEIETTIPRCPA